MTGADPGYRVVRYGRIGVCYLPHLEGGGMGFGQSYVPVVRELFGRVGRAYEFCAGPGFIGFSLLAAGLCDSLCLSDINPEAVAAARETVRRNNLQDRVAVYLSDALDGIPSHERWDLVVSNPPHFRDQYPDSLLHYDLDWTCHRRFYAAVSRHLNPAASLLIQENYAGSAEVDFLPMLAPAGLQAVGSLMYRAGVDEPAFDTFYFLWARPRAEASRLPASGRTFTAVAAEPETLPLVLSGSRASQLHLKAHTRYRFALANDLGRATTLLVHVVRHRVFRRLLRSVCTLAPGASLTTFPFQLSPGRYELSDAASKRRLVTMLVA